MACSSASSPASGEEEKKEEKLINAMFLCDEWKSSKGGLSTFNRQFAINLAQTTAGSMKIHCYVSNSDDRDREDAEQFGVNLIKARSVPGSADPLECLKFPPSQLPNPHLVIGHGRKLGSPAYSLARITKCKWIQFVHVYCEDLGKYKESDTAAEDTIEENEKKHKMEIELCKAADAVVAVGSRLQQKYSRRLLNVEVKVITPGIFKEFSNESKLAVDRSVVKKFNVSVFGRAAFEDFSLKGYDIIANAIGSLGNNFELTFVGSSPSGQRKVQQWFLDNSCINRNQLTIRRYCSEREELKMMFYQSDLVALPSRTEGFGLVALEAISAGVPVLVSGESGIAEALQKVEGGNTVIVGSDEYEGEWARRIREMYEESAEEREVNAVKLCENYRKVYSWKAECERFKGLIEKVVENGATSSEFHSISSTSESPQNQEELKKWKQKTKIVETEKLKGMLPLLGSSTSDPEEELEELHMKLQIMKGATSSEFHSISSTSESPQTQEELKKWKQKTKIVETEKLKGATSSEFHSISSTSESPQNQEELKKWKQKTKIVETEKLKGTSPLTVIPSTGHVKELIEKAQGRKGMLPLLGSSTSDPEEELEELRMKLQIMKGATSSEFHSISSTSESPQNQEELKKWKQKTKIVETEKLKDIDKIDVITEMVTTMASLKISTKGLTTLDEMKAKVKETLQSSQKKSSWTAKEAFSVLTEAKKEDERKRATLFSFYERTDVCLQSMDGKVHALLEQNIGNLKEKIASHKQNLLKKEYIVLVAGETRSGKSTLLNLILGEQLLPYSVLSTTSTICELRYGDTPKLVAHFKNRELGDTTKTVVLDEPSEASEQRYLQQISEFVHLKTNREKGSDYEKIELFWPHNLLKENIVIVDSPGIDESTIMDDIVKEYLPEAFAFIYVINSENAGGIQRDRVEKLIEHARQISLDKQRESSSNCALFVCNKWDHVPPKETDEVKNYVVTKLTQCWPSLDPESQIIYMSAREAIEAQKLGMVTKDFAELMKSIKSMVLKSIEARLQIQWRWLDYLLARMALHTKAFIRNSSKDRKNMIDRMMFITDRLQSIERQQGTVSKELQSYLEKKTDDAVTTLSRYLKSAEVMQQFSSWTLDDAPKTEESWKLTKNYIQKALMRRLQETIEEWEEKNQVFSDARASLIQYFQERFSHVVGQLRTLEESVLAGDAANSAGGPLASDDFSVTKKVIIGVTSPIWVPVGLVVPMVSVPVVGAIAVKEKLKNWNKTRQYNKDKCAFMVKASQEYLNEAAKEQHLKSFVMEQLKESQVCLKQVLDRIPQLIEADKMLCQQLRDGNRSKKEVEDFYKPLQEMSVLIRDEMALFGIKEVRKMDISCDDLEWKDDALLGGGAFAAVYRGKLKIRGDDKSVDVAVKVWNDELEVTVSNFLSEADTLRKLNHPFIVKFYGAALHKEGERLKAILVMELCKENLMRYIFRHESNIPGKSSTTTAARDVIGWAKDIADALEYIHRQGIVHRDLKLENILLSQENIVKVADVGVSKEAKAFTGILAGTPVYLAPEVINSSLYDYKADIYSLGIMLWEMWYGNRALLDVGGNVYEFFEKVVGGARPTHVEGLKKPPAGLHDLMQRCWDEKPDNRPDARECYERLTQLSQEVSAPSS